MNSTFTTSKRLWILNDGDYCIIESQVEPVDEKARLIEPGMKIDLLLSDYEKDEDSQDTISATAVEGVFEEAFEYNGLNYITLKDDSKYPLSENERTFSQKEIVGIEEVFKPKDDTFNN